MNVDRIDGTRQQFKDLTNEEVLTETERAMKDQDVTRIEILPNRHDRRRNAALARKSPKPTKDR